MENTAQSGFFSRLRKTVGRSAENWMDWVRKGRGSQVEGSGGSNSDRQKADDRKGTGLKSPNLVEFCTLFSTDSKILFVSSAA